MKTHLVTGIYFVKIQAFLKSQFVRGNGSKEGQCILSGADILINIIDQIILISLVYFFSKVSITESVSFQWGCK